jgi:antitoxin ParD1/3/4
MPNVSLTPELEAFAAACVASGRYANVSEVHRAALRLLRDAEAQRAAFTAMLLTAEEEGEQRGLSHVDDVTAELDAIIAEAEQPR